LLYYVKPFAGFRVMPVVGWWWFYSWDCSTYTVFPSVVAPQHVAPFRAAS